MSVSQKLAPSRVQAADKLDLVAVGALVGCCASWGINQTAIKIANSGISPVLQAGLRSLLAAVLVWAWAGSRGVRLFERDGTLMAGTCAGLLFAAEFLALYIGLSLTTASRAIVLLYLAPFIVAFGAHFFVPNDRLTIPKIVGLTAALGGLAVALGEGLAAPGQPTLAGDLLSLLAAVLWGVTTVLVRVTSLKSAPAEKTLLYQLVISGLILPPVSNVLAEPGITDLSPTVLWAFGYTVMVVAFISYIAWFWLVRSYPPTRVAAFTFLSPVFGVLAGNVMLGEPFTPSLAIALTLIAGGIVLVNKVGRR